MPSQLNILLSISGTPTVTVPIPAALQSLDSNTQSSISGGGQGQVSQQTGFDAISSMIQNIFKRGAFQASNGTWYPTSVITSITWQ